jgi:ethanolamine ammonia-lyase small subunit
VHSAAADRLTYLRRPDFGRRLDTASRQRLEARPTAPAELVFVIADGLSADAVNTQAVALLNAVLAGLPEKPPRFAPVVVVEGGRVAIGDEIGGLLSADLVVVLIGERPGLSAPNSLGIYVTWQPAPGTVDAARNCLSNIHAHGMSIPEAADALIALIAGARQYRMTGIGLSGRLAQHPDKPFPVIIHSPG